MTLPATRRGFDPQDAKIFSAEAIGLLRKAQQEVLWLLDRGYPLHSVITLVGSHYQLSARQRTAIQRATASTRQISARNATRLSFARATDDGIHIDGFNLIITLEVALAGSVLILGNDGVLRDLAGLRGTYRPIAQTDQALSLIGEELKKLHVPAVKFFLDSPVSNSGRLKSRILEHAANWGIPTTVELVPNADVPLARLNRIITSDSILLDTGCSWFNLSRKIVTESQKDAWVVNLNNEIGTT